MKKLLLTGVALSLVIASFAQNRPAPANTLKERLQATNKWAPVPYQKAISGDEIPSNKVSLPASNRPTGVAKTSMVPMEVIGLTTYDLQSNGSVQNRIYKDNNGNVGATWTFSVDPAPPAGGLPNFADRGTGYNYYDGTAWGPIPTSRIEVGRHGWPSLVKLANGSENVVSHQSVDTTTRFNTRPTAGSGAWSQTTNPTFPNGEASLWARTAAGGPDGNTLHMIDISYPTANGGALVNGLDGCFNYSRSLDGGTNWDIVRALPPGVNATEYDGFRADGYAIDSKDNIVAFVSGDITDDWALWKSTDNGANFTRTVILDFPWTKYNGLTQITDVDGDGAADTVETTDGDYAILIDNNGMIHAFAGAMLVLDNDPATDIGLFLESDGLFYWNESFGSNPPMIIATAPDLDGSGFADAFAADLGGRYGNAGICSMPSAGIDAQGNLFVSYCPLIEGTDSGNPTPLSFSYRNVYLTSSTDGGATWSTGLNISDSQFDEGVYCSMAKNVDDCVSLLWQQDGLPGVALTTVPQQPHSVGSNDIIYACVDKNLVLSSVNEVLNDNVSVSVFPNPASDNVMINYTVEKQVELIIEIRNIMGQVVANYTKNAESKGTHSINLNVEKYSDGVYTVNTIIGDKVFSTKFVKN